MRSYWKSKYIPKLSLKTKTNWNYKRNQLIIGYYLTKYFNNKFIIKIYCGKIPNTLEISNDLYLNHKIGEFTETRKTFLHKRSKDKKKKEKEQKELKKKLLKNQKIIKKKN